MKKLIALLTASALTAACLCACGSSASSSEAASSEAASSEAVSSEAASSEAASSEDASSEASEEETVGMANPWTETTREGMMQATGLELNEPENGENFQYSVLQDEGLGQMTYTMKETGDKVTARIKATAVAEDISGVFGVENMMTDEIDGMTYNSGSMTMGWQHIQVCTWFDVVPGISYSVEVSSDGDLDGLDIIGVAMQVYKPMQGDADPDAASLYDGLAGVYETKNQNITMTIDESGAVSVSIVRLTQMDGAVTGRENGVVSIIVKDANDGDMLLELDEATLTLTVTDSTWDLLHTGQTFTFDSVSGL